MILFGPLAPDRGQISTTGVVLQANNVIPRVEGYGPMQGLDTPASATALSSAPRGMVSLVKNNRDWIVIAGLAADWLQLSASYTWASLSGSFACPAGYDWSFEHFGNFLLGTNTVDGMQAYNVESPAGFTHIAAAGKPAFIFECNDRMVALNCLDDAGARNTRLIRTSKINDHTAWTAAVGGDYQPLEAGGQLLWGADLEQNAAILAQERALMLMTFGSTVGAAKFGLSVISIEVGAAGAKSLVGYDKFAYWLGNDARFYRFSLGSGLQDISDETVAEWFGGRVSVADLSSVQGSLDPTTKIVWWRYKQLSGSSDIVFDNMIGWSIKRQRWVTASPSTAYLSRLVTAAAVTDDLDGLGPIDSIDIAVDSPIWQGGAQVFAAIGSDLKYATFTGQTLQPTIETSSAANPVTGLVGRITSLDDCTDALISLGVRNRMDSEIDWKSPEAKTESGSTPVRGRGTFIAFQWSAPAGATWTESKGIDQIQAAAGGRK